MIRPMKFEPGAFLMECSMCGFRYRSTELFKGEDGFWRCRRTCLEVPAITRDKISAESQKRREAPPPPHGKPFDRLSTFADEAVIFDFLVTHAVVDPGWPGGFRTGIAPMSATNTTNGGFQLIANASYQTVAAAETCRYCYALIQEAKRPTRWTIPATAKLREQADWLISIQVGFGSLPSATKSSSAFWGGMPSTTGGTTWSAEHTSMGGLALLHAYRILGDAKYLASAMAAASFLRNIQAIGSHGVAGFTSSDPGGTVRLYTGALMDRLNSTSFANGNHRFFPSSLVGVEFWKELFNTAGDALYGADTTAGGVFTSAPQQLLSLSIAQSRVFWSTGTFDVSLGSIITGLSATTPREYFSAYPAGTGSWVWQDAGGTLITASNFAMAMRSLYAYEGFSSQISSVWTWLMGFASNPAFVSPAGTLATDFACASTTLAANPPPPPPRSGNVVAPFYDPKLALTTLLLVRTPVTFTSTAQNGTSIYDWSTSGLMAAIQSSQNGGAFRKAKEAVTTIRHRLPVTFTGGEAPIEDWAMLRTQTGLAFQMNQIDASNRRQWLTVESARVGAMFRYQPQGFTGTQSPTQQPGVRV